MNNNEKFEKIYNVLLDKYSTEFEEIRLKILAERKRNRKIVPLLCLIPILVLVFCASNPKMMEDDLGVGLFMMSCILVAVVCVMLYRNKTIKNYERYFKEKVITDLIKQYKFNLDYKPQEGIARDIFEKQELNKFNSYYSNDLIIGKIDENNFIQIADVHAEYTERIGDKHHTKTIFHGLLSVSKIKKSINEEIYITKNEKIFDKISTRKIGFAGSEFEIDSQEFEKIFNVYTTNEILTMQLLTADIMETLVEFYQYIKKDIEITVKDDYIYFRLWNGVIFEVPPIKKHSLDKNILYKNYQILNFMCEVTKKVLTIIDELL